METGDSWQANRCACVVRAVGAAGLQQPSRPIGPRRRVWPGLALLMSSSPCHGHKWVPQDP
eukprot:2113268-Pleurochrysis_carterae.AAC.4